MPADFPYRRNGGVLVCTFSVQSTELLITRESVSTINLLLFLVEIPVSHQSSPGFPKDQRYPAASYAPYSSSLGLKSKRLEQKTALQQTYNVSHPDFASLAFFVCARACSVASTAPPMSIAHGWWMANLQQDPPTLSRLMSGILHLAMKGSNKAM